jgi:membrane-bound lytic murein transglycosylase D
VIPRETTNYVPIIVAMTIMHKNAKAYGLDELEFDPPLRYETVEFEAPTHLALIADAADRPVSEIRELNPALLTSIAPAGYAVHLPAGSRTMVLAALESIPPAKRASWRVHRVGENDTIESIAKQYRVPVSAIEQVNAGADAEPGEVLAIPTKSEVERVRSTPARKAAVKKPTARRGSSTGSTASGKSSAKRSTSKAAPSRRRVQSASFR